ncbi:MAG: hypothetical protein AAF502_08690 [Bacteroidota bacterium]
MKTTASIVMLFCTLQLFAQKPVNKEFYFTNGVYLTYEDFKNDLPALSWNVLDAEAHIDGNEHLVRFSEILMLDDQTPVDIESIWGVSIEGKPYLNINKVKGKERLRSSGEDPVLFVRLQAIGNLCYFFYEAYVSEKVAMHVYDPRTGVRLRTGVVENMKPIAIKKILKFETGEVIDYNLSNFKKLIKSDEALYNTLIELSDTEARSKMYKSLFIFNERNPVFINSKS